MIVLEESPWYQEILRRGEHKERVRTLVRILQQRFGAVSSDVAGQLATLDMQTLDDLADSAITVPSLAEFRQVLSQHTTPEQPDNDA